MQDTSIASNLSTTSFHRPPSPVSGILPDREEQPLLGGSLCRSDSNATVKNSGFGLGLGLESSSLSVNLGTKVLRSGRTVTGPKVGSGTHPVVRVAVDIESPKGSPGRSAPFMPNRKRSTRTMAGSAKSSAGSDEVDLASAHQHVRTQSASSEFVHAAGADPSTNQKPLTQVALNQLQAEVGGQGLMRSNSMGMGPSSTARARVAVTAAAGFDRTASTGYAYSLASSSSLAMMPGGGGGTTEDRHLRDCSGRQNVVQPTRSISPSRPASPVKDNGGYRIAAGGGSGLRPLTRQNSGALKGRPLSMYDIPSSTSAPFLPPGGSAPNQDTIVKKRKQIATAKRLKDAREGNLVASVSAAAGSTPPSLRSREPPSSPVRNSADDRRRGAPAMPNHHRTLLPSNLYSAQPSVLDSIAMPVMDEEEEGDTSFVYDADRQGAHGLGENDDDPFQGDGGSAAEDSVQVHVRIRPPYGQDDDLAWDAYPGGRTVSLTPRLAQGRVGVTTTSFAFDGVHTSSANKPIYLSVARPLIRSVLDGYDAVVFAYGQTGSGKTWTLSGDDEGREPGLMPRAIKDIFAGIRQASTTREYLIRVSYLEVYNENLQDLLMPSNSPQVRDENRGGRRGTVVKPLQEEIVTTPAQVMALLALGQANRHVGATEWNERSSRSHTAVKMTIESWERVSDEPWATELDPDRVPGSPAKQRTQGRTVRVSELSMIDLAGSERYVSKGGSAARSEGSAINKSLLCLGRVISALSARKEGDYVPFRDSKLTRILQNSLGGNARVAVVCTLNPNSTAVEESLSTLSFAKRVKKVTLNAQRNEIDAAASLGTEGQALLHRYRSEAESLRKQVCELQVQATRTVDESNASTSTAPLNDERIEELRKRLEQIGGLIMIGGGEDETDEEEEDADGRRSPFKRPMSPSKRGFRFDEGVPALQEKLFKASTRVRELEGRLAGRPSLLPPSVAEVDKDAMIRQLKKQVSELELVCEAQASQGPLPKTKEDVEREWQKKVNDLQAELGKRDRYILDLSRECHSLRSTNRQLMRIAHLDTKSAISNLSSPGAGGSTPTPSTSVSTFNPSTPPRRARVPRRSVSMMSLQLDESRLI
ncbi:hypothetical protein A4X06_0g1415 [Tilletia controversa]|uniref:Kinesin motor domain-containing protein n=1 Tax=Tilletia controversa TaxID=13291 RepID=A0A8X7MZU7_9BASI|nr:hypothetical protein CF328_g78 [Tilletia controversa]KAE8253492.1 hypothetical protein A4X06_0g1415 [Tilletia controversa]